jgi:hypothetical protein
MFPNERTIGYMRGEGDSRGVSAFLASPDPSFITTSFCPESTIPLPPWWNVHRYQNRHIVSFVPGLSTARH